jgi:hypothetical protein
MVMKLCNFSRACAVLLLQTQNSPFYDGCQEKFSTAVSSTVRSEMQSAQQAEAKMPAACCALKLRRTVIASGTLL